MEWRPPGLSVFLSLVILPSTIKSRRSFFLPPAHLGGPGKRAVKRLWCCVVASSNNCVGFEMQFMHSLIQHISIHEFRTHTNN